MMPTYRLYSLMYIHMYVSHRQRFFHLGARNQRSCQISDRIMHYTLALFVESQSQAVRSSGLYISIYVCIYIDVLYAYVHVHVHTYVKSSHQVATVN